MTKPEPAVVKETRYIAVWEVIFSVLLQAVFLVAGLWDITVLLGNVYSAFFAVLNFYLMGITVQKSLDKEEKEAKTYIMMSQKLRTLMLFAAAVVGALLPCFNIFAALLPLLFPRIAVALRVFFKK